MPLFLAITSRGLVEPLGEELLELNCKSVRVRPDGVEFQTPWSDLGRVLLSTRLASRVLLPVADFTAYNEEDLYYGVLRRHDFTNYISLKQTFRVEAKVREHVKLRDQRFVAMKVKDAIVDQFRKKFGERPNVGDEETADLRVVVRVVGPKVSLAIDVTGESLSHRGYRAEAGEAPIRENVAAGLLRIAGWKPGVPLVDPFCGSGTILIEAALTAMGRSPQIRRRRFVFQKLKGHAGDLKENSVVPSATSVEPLFFGFDLDRNVLKKAQANAERAGVGHLIKWQACDIKDLKRPLVDAGMLVTNPPYGERLEDTEKAKALMAEFATTLKREFNGWSAWILSGNKEAIQGLRLKATRRAPVWNGPIECRLLNYPLR